MIRGLTGLPAGQGSSSAGPCVHPVQRAGQAGPGRQNPGKQSDVQTVRRGRVYWSPVAPDACPVESTAAQRIGAILTQITVHTRLGRAAAPKREAFVERFFGRCRRFIPKSTIGQIAIKGGTGDIGTRVDSTRIIIVRGSARKIAGRIAERRLDPLVVAPVAVRDRSQVALS